MAPRFLFTQNLEAIPPSYVDYLGAFGQIFYPALPSSKTIGVASVAIESTDAIFVGVCLNDISPHGTVTGTDNLGNTYTAQAGPHSNGPMLVTLLGCLNPAAGVLTSITVSWTALASSGSVAMRAHRFRNVGPVEASTNEMKQASSWSTDNFILTQAGSPGSLGVGVMGVRTAGQTGNPYTTGGAVFLGSNYSPPPPSVSDSNHACVIMAYVSPPTSVGLGQSFLTFDGSRAWTHCGKVYSAA